MIRVRIKSPSCSSISVAAVSQVSMTFTYNICAFWCTTSTITRSICYAPCITTATMEHLLLSANGSAIAPTLARPHSRAHTRAPTLAPS